MKNNIYEFTTSELEMCHIGLEYDKVRDSIAILSISYLLCCG